MALYKNMAKTANKLINKYGNSVSITIEIVSGEYDPSVGGYPKDTSIVNTKGSFSKATNEELSKSGVTEMLWGNVSAKVMIPYNDEVSELNNNCKVNGMKIYSKEVISIQDKAIVIKLLVG